MKYVCPTCKEPHGTGDESKAPRLCPKCQWELTDDIERKKIMKEAREEMVRKANEIWIQEIINEKKPEQNFKRFPSLNLKITEIVENGEKTVIMERMRELKKK